MSVIEIDKGFNKIIDNFTKLSKTELKVGIFEDATNDGKSIAEYAHTNEFGGLTLNGAIIPSRSFMRSTYEEKNGWKEEIEAVYNEVLQGNSVENAVGRLGEKVTNDIKEKISNNVPPPNAPSTIAKKRSSKTLIDTGKMRQAVRPVINFG